jgi:hypothetical protein
VTWLDVRKHPATNRALLARVVVIAVVIYPLGAAFLHYVCGWWWPFTILITAIGGIGSIVLSYRRLRT